MSRRRAVLNVPERPGYPAGLRAGLEAAGLAVVPAFREPLAPSDVLVTWTLWRGSARRALAERHRRRGGTTWCLEHGIVRSVGDRGHWQLGLRVGEGTGINGQGRAPEGGPERWQSWGLAHAPWRRDGGHVLVCGQRGTRPHDPDLSHGPGWADDVIERLRRVTDRPIRYRAHPGAPGRALPQGAGPAAEVTDARAPLAADLAGAWAVVVYSSTAATAAILAGVPVLYDGPAIACRRLALKGPEQVERPALPARAAELARLAWYQWSDAELADGRPFVRLLEAACG